MGPNYFTSNVLLPLIVNDAAATSNTAATLWRGGRGGFVVEAGSWGGGSVKLQYKSPNGTLIDVADSAATTNDVRMFELPPGELKAVASVATGVYAYIVGSGVR